MERTIEDIKQLSGDYRCPYCHDVLACDLSAECTVCNVQQHLECFFDHRSCSVHGCENTVVTYGRAMFSYAEVQAFESFADFELFVDETLRQANIEYKNRPRVGEAKSHWHDLLSAVLFLCAASPWLFAAMALIQGGIIAAAGLAALSSLVTATCLLCHRGLSKADLRFNEDSIELKESRSAEAPRDLQLQPFNYWRDILGYQGFDPFTGVMAGSSELPLLEDGGPEESSEKLGLMDRQGDEESYDTL
jgi:hypothetical protein